MNDEKRICLNQSVLDFMANVLSQCEKPLVLEFGSGWSSAWLAARCGQLITVETDPKWAQRVERDLNEAGYDNWQMYKGITPLDSLFLNGAQANLILVDCRADLRMAASRLGYLCLKEGGWILFDDAQRPRHNGDINWLNDKMGFGTVLEWGSIDVQSAKERVCIAWQKVALEEKK